MKKNEKKPQRTESVGMEVLLVKPGCHPEEIWISEELEEMQAAVGGRIQEIFPFPDPVALIANDDGKLLSLPLNRALFSETGELYDVIAGSFLIVGVKRDHFCSLSAALKEKYKAYFRYPETFLRIGDRILALPVLETEKPDRSLKKETCR